MPASLDPFVDVLLREGGDQLYLLPDEPVTMVKDGKPRKVSRQPLTDKHIYALLVEVAPTESSDQIDKMTETTFDYVADRGLVHVRVVPDMGRLTAVITPGDKSACVGRDRGDPGDEGAPGAGHGDRLSPDARQRDPPGPALPSHARKRRRMRHRLPVSRPISAAPSSKRSSGRSASCSSSLSAPGLPIFTCGWENRRFSARMAK